MERDRRSKSHKSEKGREGTWRWGRERGMRERR